MEHFGILSLTPAILFLVLALLTRKTLTSAIIAGLSGYIIYYKLDFVAPAVDNLVLSMTDYDNMWIVLVVLLFGSFIALLREAKGTNVFGNFARKYANTEKKSLMLAWLMGIIIFIDDYLSILTTANTMMPITDGHKTPREMLTYVINTTSAPVCVIIPISAWVVFFSGVFELQPECAVLGSTGTEIYYSIMPYFFYPFLCVIFVPLVILGVIPKLGGMKKAYKRVEETGKLWPDTSDMLNKTEMEEKETGENQSGSPVKEELELTATGKKPRLWTFLVPMGLVIVVTIVLGDILMGVIAGIVSCISFIPARVMTFDMFTKRCLDGVLDMMYIAIILILSLFYRQSMLLVGLPEYMVEVAEPFMNAALLPAIVFVVVGLVCFATGSIWSIPALTTPIFVPLAAAVDANMALTLGAIVSAAIFGAQACFYSDVTLMSSSATRMNNVDYAASQLPYIIIVATISVILFVIAGFVF